MPGPVSTSGNNAANGAAAANATAVSRLFMCPRAPRERSAAGTFYVAAGLQTRPCEGTCQWPRVFSPPYGVEPRPGRMVSAGLRLDAAEKLLAEPRRFSSTAGARGARSRPAEPYGPLRVTHVGSGEPTLRYDGLL